MRQAHARTSFDAYLDAPRRAERPQLRVVEDLAVEAPTVDIPDWAEPFADSRFDARLGEPPRTEADGRRTVVVTGHPVGPHWGSRRERSVTTTAKVRRSSPTRARLAGRPDRVALWAVALALVMAAMAGFTGGNHGHASKQSTPPIPAAPLDR